MTVSLMVGTDHPVPISSQGGTITLTVDQTGGTVYYADNRQVSAGSNQGSISPGGSKSFTSNVWVIGSALAGVTVATTSISDEWAADTPVSLVNASRYLVPSGGDDAAAMQAAINAIGGSGQVLLGPGTFLWNSTPPALPRNATRVVIRGAGRGSTIIRLSSSCPRVFDIASGSAGDTFQNIDIEDFTVDANWVGGQHHTIIGTDRNGSVASGIDLNLLWLTHRRLTIINQLTDANVGLNHRRGILYYLTSSTVTPTVDEILFEDCNFEGGNAGYEVLGANAGTGVQIGSVRSYRCRHKMRQPLASTVNQSGSVTLTGSPQNITVTSTTGFASSGVAMGSPGGANTPIAITYTGVSGGNTLVGCTGSGTIVASGVIAQWGQGAAFGPQTLWFPSSNIQVGSYATVKHVTAVEFEGYYSGDVGSEIDNKDFALFDRCHFEDAFKNNNYFTNFTTPANPDVQTCVYRDHISRRSLVANQFAGGCFEFDTHTSIPLGRVRFEGECFAVNTSGNITTADCVNQTGQIQSMDLDGLRCIIEGFTFSSGTIGHTAVALSPNAVSGKAPNVKLGRMYVKASGTYTGGTYTFDGLLLTPNAMDIDSESPAFDIGVTGVANGSLRCIEVNGSGSSPTARGRLDGIQVLNMSGDGAPRGIMVRGTGSVTLSNLLITACDFSGMAAGGNEVFYVDATNKGQVRQYGNVYKTKPAPTTWAALTSATGFIQQFGWDAILQFAQGSGAGITAIDFSTNGGTTYTNFLTQASAALPAGFDQCLVLPAGGFLKVTFATTQPTINVVPLNP